MLCVVDIGNTNITIGVFHLNSIKSFRISSDKNKTSDEYFLIFKGIIENGTGEEIEKIEGFCISSVVPTIQDLWEAMVSRYFPEIPVVILGPGIKTGISILYDNPKDVGADRIANAVGAWEIYMKKKKKEERVPIVVVDSGTAMTFDCISEKGEYLGGIIFPGVFISLSSLSEKTAKLPNIQLKVPQHIIGKNTVESIQSGIIYGYASLIDGIISKLKDEFNVKPFTIATGGYIKLIAPHSKLIDVIDENLTLWGLKFIFEKNVKGK